MTEKFKNAAEYLAALTEGHDIIRIDDPNFFWNTIDAEEIDNFEEVNNKSGLCEQLDEYVSYIALKLNDERYINNNCFKIYYNCTRHYYIISQLFWGIAAEDVGFAELDEEDRY